MATAWPLVKPQLHNLPQILHRPGSYALCLSADLQQKRSTVAKSAVLSEEERPSKMRTVETPSTTEAVPASTPAVPNQPSKLTEEEQQKEIQKAREPQDGKQGTVPPSQEKEGYVADLDE